MGSKEERRLPYGKKKVNGKIMQRGGSGRVEAQLSRYYNRRDEGNHRVSGFRGREVLEKRGTYFWGEGPG